MVREISIEGKDIDYGFGGEIIAVDGVSVASGPKFSKSNDRQLLLSQTAEALVPYYKIMRFPHLKGNSSKYELWLGEQKFSLRIYVPAKTPKAGAAAHLPLISAIADKLNKKVYLNMVELYPGTYLKITERK